MVLDTGTLAGITAATIGNALLAPFRTDEVRESLRVLASIRLKAIATDALVGQCCLSLLVTAVTRNSRANYVQDHKYWH